MTAMKSLLVGLATVIPLVLGASETRSNTIAIGASKDNSIFENFPTNSAGGTAGIYVGGTATRSPRRGLVAFDVAGSVPAGATITSAQLTLYLALGSGNSVVIELHKLLADWGEGTAGSDLDSVHFGGAGFQASAGDATWNQRFFGSTNWTNPGADGDFNATASGAAFIGLPNIDVANPTPFSWFSTASLVSDVQSWLDDPATNFGWILINTGEAVQGSARAFFSRSATLDTAGFPLQHDVHPALTITYSLDVPEPALGGLLAIAALFAAGRWSR